MAVARGCVTSSTSGQCWRGEKPGQSQTQKAEPASWAGQLVHATELRRPTVHLHNATDPQTFPTPALAAQSLAKTCTAAFFAREPVSAPAVIPRPATAFHAPGLHSNPPDATPLATARPAPPAPQPRAAPGLRARGTHDAFLKLPSSPFLLSAPLSPEGATTPPESGISASAWPCVPNTHTHIDRNPSAAAALAPQARLVQARSHALASAVHPRSRTTCSGTQVSLPLPPVPRVPRLHGPLAPSCPSPPKPHVRREEVDGLCVGVQLDVGLVGLSPAALARLHVVVIRVHLACERRIRSCYMLH
jgi:hypothetical protein